MSKGSQPDLELGVRNRTQGSLNGSAGRPVEYKSDRITLLSSFSYISAIRFVGGLSCESHGVILVVKNEGRMRGTVR